MLVPRSRLLKWVAVLVLPMALSAAVSSEAALVAGTAVALFCAVVVLDAVLGLGALEGIGIELPGVIRFSKGREGLIELQVVNEKQTAKQLRLGLALPAEFVSKQEDLMAVLPAKSRCSRLTWPCTPLKRGNYALRDCYLETASPLGFWAVRGVAPAASEMRVYPNLQNERNSVAALFLNRGSLGLHVQRQVGKGRDFEKLRDYALGDSYEEIHWKATARRGKPITKVFQIERTQEVYVIIDTSRLSGRDPVEKGRGESKRPGAVEPSSALERFITAGLVLGLAAEQQGDLFGLVTFSDHVHRFVRAKNGKAHYNSCRDSLYTLEPSIVSPDFEELCSFIRLRLRRRALLIVLTSLDDPVIAESFVRNVELISRQHLVLVNMMTPPGVGPLFRKGAEVSRVDDLYSKLGGHLRWNELRNVEKTLKRRGVHFSLLENEKLTAQLITQYLSVKRRQLL